MWLLHEAARIVLPCWSILRIASSTTSALWAIMAKPHLTPVYAACCTTMSNASSYYPDVTCWIQWHLRNQCPPPAPSVAAMRSLPITSSSSAKAPISVAQQEYLAYRQLPSGGREKGDRGWIKYTGRAPSPLARARAKAVRQW